MLICSFSIRPQMSLLSCMQFINRDRRLSVQTSRSVLMLLFYTDFDLFLISFIITWCNSCILRCFFLNFIHQAEGPAVKDAVEAKIFDLYITKFWGIKFATRAACTVLSVDQVGFWTMLSLSNFNVRILFMGKDTSNRFIIIMIIIHSFPDHHG